MKFADHADENYHNFNEIMLFMYTEAKHASISRGILILISFYLVEVDKKNKNPISYYYRFGSLFLCNVTA